MALVVENLLANAGNARMQAQSLGLRFPGEENGDLPQDSCLEHSMDRGVCPAPAHGVAKTEWVRAQTHTHTCTHTHATHTYMHAHTCVRAHTHACARTPPPHTHTPHSKIPGLILGFTSQQAIWLAIITNSCDGPCPLSKET